MTTTSIRGILAAAICAAALTGCNSTGPVFQPVKPPAGQGVIYIYRQPKLVGSGVYGTVKVNGTPVTKIKNGGYFPYVGKPGAYTITATTEATGEVKISLGGGQTKYVKAAIRPGIVVGRISLQEMPADYGLSEIRACKRLE